MTIEIIKSFAILISHKNCFNFYNFAVYFEAETIILDILGHFFLAKRNANRSTLQFF